MLTETLFILQGGYSGAQCGTMAVPMALSDGARLSSNGNQLLIAFSEPILVRTAGGDAKSFIAPGTPFPCDDVITTSVGALGSDSSCVQTAPDVITARLSRSATIASRDSITVLAAGVANVDGQSGALDKTLVVRAPFVLTPPTVVVTGRAMLTTCESVSQHPVYAASAVGGRVASFKWSLVTAASAELRGFVSSTTSDTLSFFEDANYKLLLDAVKLRPVIILFILIYNY